jgi:hypothetical protein
MSMSNIHGVPSLSQPASWDPTGTTQMATLDKLAMDTKRKKAYTISAGTPRRRKSTAGDAPESDAMIFTCNHPVRSIPSAIIVGMR